MSDPVSGITVRLSPLIDRSAIAADWLELQERSDCSFYLSWGWIGTWLGLLPDAVSVHEVRALRDGAVVGLGLVARGPRPPYGYVPLAAGHLHATGIGAIDRICIEHNGWLCDRRYGEETCQAMTRRLCGAIREGLFDEFHLPGVAPDFIDPDSAEGLVVAAARQRIARQVDLVKVRKSAGGYESLLSHNTRNKLRRSAKAFRREGPLELGIASTVEEARDWFRELVAWHQRHWTSRGRVGAFGSAFAHRFHQQLVESRFPHGDVELLRLTVSGQPVAYLYMHLRRGVVHAYQAALMRFADNVRSPGLLLHKAAIEHYARRGEAAYDFLAGPDQYKKQLGTVDTTLEWLIVHRATRVLKMEDWLRATHQARLRD